MGMSFAGMFGMLDNSPSFQQQQQQESSNIGYDPFTQPPEPQYQDQPSMSWEEAFSNFKTHPVLYNMDGFISPYSSNNWGGTSKILQYIDDQSRLPAVENKVDPNKIFTAEINGLRALEADQQKVLKLFEKKFYESLSEKGKFGLTEEDIEAMSAITSGRTAIANINKERVNIKKNIADIRIKQNQMSNNPAAANANGDGGRLPGSVMDIGRSMLDQIFDTPSMTPNMPSSNIDYSPLNSSDAGRVLDNLVPNVNSNLQFESKEPKTYVVVGDTDQDISFETYDAEGNLMADYPAPDVTITNIDRDANKAVDEFLVEYPLKEK